MRIEIVQLENMRSHVKSTVPFARGFNCLVGGLGCGKSSILFAIDFALFGEPLGRSFDYLLREGADSAKVTVQFAHNGNTYTLSRGLRKRGKGIGQDPDQLKLFEGERLISSSKSEAVAEQVKAVTGLDKELFREIVWVRQEHLKELLNAQPRDRQKRLDELFGLSDYETAWSSISAYQRDYEGERRAYEKDADITGMDRLGSEYNRTAEQFTLLEVELEDLTGKLAQAKKTLEEAETKLKRLEEVKTQNEELRRKEARMAANVSSVRDALSSLSRKVASEKTSAEDMRQRLAAMGKQLGSYNAELAEAGLPPDQPLEALKRQMAVFDDQISKVRGELEAAAKNMETDQKRMASLSAESLCPLCLQGLSDEYKNDLMRRIEDENNQRRSLISQLQQDVEKLRQVRQKASAALSNVQLFTPRIEDAKARAGDEENALAELNKELADKQRLEEELHAQLDLVRAEISQFDVSALEDAKATWKQSLELHSRIMSELQLKQNRKEDLARILNEMRERIDHAQQKIERMQKISRSLEILSSIRDAYRSIQPKLRGEFVKVLRNFTQQVLDGLASDEGPMLNINVDETYTPYVVSEGNVEREVSNLSGGERTLLAFAYRLGLGQLIMQSRTGHGLSMLLLDEPTESLGSEDGSIDRLAEAISRFKAVEQTIAVTHSEPFAEKAEHVIRLEKEAGESRVSVER